MFHKTLLAVVIGMLGVTLFSSPAHADARWLYVATNVDGVAIYMDKDTLCFTQGGDISMFLRSVGPSGTYTHRVVIDVERRSYCGPDDYDSSWKAIPPESILEDIWSVAYQAKYGRYSSR